MADSSSIVPAWGCNICFEESQNPVCTSCGHLFCWPCLYAWVHDLGKPCPVCRTALTLHANVIPVFVTTQAEPAQPVAANAAATIPPRPHPRAPTASNSAPDPGANTVRYFYRETVEEVRRQEIMEHARLAQQEEEIARMQNLVDTDTRSLVRLRRALKELRRRRSRHASVGGSSAGSGTTTGHASTSDSLINIISHRVEGIDRAHGEEVIRRVLNAVVGRRVQ